MTTVSRFALSSVAIAAVALALWWAAAGASTDSQPVADRAADRAAPASFTDAPRREAPAATATADPAAPAPVVAAAASDAVPPIAADPVATAPAVPDRYAPQVASVVEATRTGQHPERLSIAIDPAPFDAAAYARDPQSYLDVVEPARVYQTAPAGDSAVPLRATVDHAIPVAALGSTDLAVIARPLAPVTFSVLDGGRLPNGLTSITVAADAQGRAVTTYTATQGTVDEVQILVGSPMTVGTLTLRVAVAYPVAAPAVSAR